MLFLQNATGKPPLVNISQEFEANFGSESVTFAFKKTSQSSQPTSQSTSQQHHGHHGGEGAQQVKLVKKSNRMEIFLWKWKKKLQLMSKWRKHELGWLPIQNRCWFEKRLIIIAAFKTTTKHLGTKIVEKAITKKNKIREVK